MTRCTRAYASTCHCAPRAAYASPPLPPPPTQYAPTKAILEAMFQSGLSAPTVEGEPLTDRWFGTLTKLQQLVQE